MSCPQCQGIEELFSDQLVNKELAAYRAKGADKTTRWMIEAIKKEGIRGLSLLDIGGGVGAVQAELLGAGCESAVDVDASNAYLQAARDEAKRRGLAERINYIHGNFVDLAEQIPPTDIVTLDRVICCYPDMEKMVSLSTTRARKLYSLVYPRDAWWVRAGLAVMNFIFSLRKSNFRIFPHPRQAVEAIISRNGLTLRYHRQTLVWQVAVYSR